MTPRRTLRAAALSLAFVALRCSLLTDFTDCRTDADCRLGERCNRARSYCEVPAPELCNGADDDHDGVADEAEDFGPCEDASRGPPRCRDGRRRCVGGRLTCVYRTTPTATEVCFNGVDEDCNGTVDDGAGCVVNYGRSSMVRVGSDDPAAGEGDDAPEHRVCLAPFSIDKHEVSNRAFLAWLNGLDPSKVSVGRPPSPLNRTRAYGNFVMVNEGTAQAPRMVPLVLLPQPGDPGYDRSLRRRGELFETLRAGIDDLPVTFVTWLAADRYCRWAGKHLPSEAEFFRAMQGDNGARTYPWGNDAPTCQRANVAVGPNRAPCVGEPLPVASREMGVTPEGVFHLYGNVDEWMFDYLDTTPNHDCNRYYFRNATCDPMMRPAPNAWCMAAPEGPLGPAMGSPIQEPNNAMVQRCTQCRFSRGRRYESTDTRPLIRKWMDADNADPGIGFRCATGGATMSEGVMR